MSHRTGNDRGGGQGRSRRYQPRPVIKGKPKSVQDQHNTIRTINEQVGIHTVLSCHKLLPAYKRYPFRRVENVFRHIRRHPTT